MLRDTMGNSGCNKRMSIGNFVFSLVQYIGDSSKKHASKMLSPTTGLHMFPSVPEVSVPLWGKVQKCDILRLILSAVDGQETVKARWHRDIDFFHQVEIEDGDSITDLIQKYCKEGLVCPFLALPSRLSRCRHKPT